MNTVTQTMYYRQALINYANKYGVTKAAVVSPLYLLPKLEIPNTGSKNPFWAVEVCIIGIGAVFALALI